MKTEHSHIQKAGTSGDMGLDEDASAANNFSAAWKLSCLVYTVEGGDRLTHFGRGPL